MSKKFISVLLATVIAASILTGCSANSNTAEKKNGKTKITYMAFSATPDHDKDMKTIIDEFEAQNPDITIDYQPVAYNDYFTKLQTLIASGTAPDTFELNYENFVGFASKGTLLDLSDQISKDKNFDSGVYDKNAYNVFNYNNKQYGLVSSFSNVVLFYNKDLFDKAGVKYPDSSWTWKDELAAAQKLTDSSKGIWGTYSPIQFTEFYKTIAQNGGSLFNQDKTQITINSKQNVDTLQWMVDKINKYKVTPSDSQMAGQRSEDLFNAGKLAMVRTGIWMFSSFKNAPFKWDIALEPGNTQKAHHFFANSAAISAKTKNADAAWKWIKFYTSSKDVAKIRIDSSWELPALSDKSILNSYLSQTPPASRQVVFDALKTLVVPPVTDNWNEVSDAVGKELDQARLGSKTPQKALDDAQNEVKSLLKK